MIPVLTTAYWPNLHYFYYLLNSGTVKIEQHENYQKQSYRNRTHILSANGLLPLSIPIHKKEVKELTKDITISYHERWQSRHWGAILSAYKNSPYFDYLEEDIHYFYTQRFDLLMEYNTQQIHLLLKLLKTKREIQGTNEFQKESSSFLDRRGITDLKNDFRQDVAAADHLTTPYYQTFNTKFQFHPNLSILDLLFNTGLESLDYLSDQRKPSAPI